MILNNDIIFILRWTNKKKVKIKQGLQKLQQITEPYNGPVRTGLTAYLSIHYDDE